MNYAIFLELCDRMRFEVNNAKSHHHVISDGLHHMHQQAWQVDVNAVRGKQDKEGEKGRKHYNYHLRLCLSKC